MYAENLYFQSSSSVGSPGMDAIGVPVAIAVAGVLLRFCQYWHQDLCSSVALVCCSCSCSVRCVVLFGALLDRYPGSLLHYHVKFNGN